MKLFIGINIMKIKFNEYFAMNFSKIIKDQVRAILPKTVVEALILLKYFRVKEIPDSGVYIGCVENKKGIEIGGPSILFKTALPLYQKIRSLDGVNFSGETIWEGKISSGLGYNYFGNKRGVQFISDAIDLAKITDDTYDFLLSSNCLEHIANPLKALIEWRRVLKSDGSLILVLPNKDNNFDRNRPTVTFEHLLQDFNCKTTEYDLTHLDEILSCHDLSLDPMAGDIEAFKKRCLVNFDNRALHHHVFDLNVMKAMLEYCGLEVIKMGKTDNDLFSLSAKRG
jgi:SAM-dependent methyltransferase